MSLAGKLLWDIENKTKHMTAAAVSSSERATTSPNVIPLGVMSPEFWMNSVN